jgi:Polyketide cyclase / dehydrase and lipid transport
MPAQRTLRAMRTVNVTAAFPGTVHEAESCWYDTSAWPRWVNGLEQVEETTRGWPAVGASVTWRSGPAGRGRVRERVVAHEPLTGQTVAVADDSIEGRQTVEFTPVDDSVEIALALQYEIKQRSLFTPLVDFLFIRRAMETELRTTLERFGAELAARRAAGGAPLG